MNDKEILQKAIQKAILNGWSASVENSLTGDWLIFGNTHTLLNGAAPYEAIFNHDFAKALWGEEQNEFDPIISYNIETGEGRRLNSYEKHLQNMVISDDPIKYLGENI